MADRKAVLLANHGLLAGGTSLADAFNVIEEIEFCCEIYYRTKSIGDPVILPEDEMARMVERFKAYGKNRRNMRKYRQKARDRSIPLLLYFLSL